jgi:hypothetical protein
MTARLLKTKSELVSIYRAARAGAIDIDIAVGRVAGVTRFLRSERECIAALAAQWRAYERALRRRGRELSPEALAVGATIRRLTCICTARCRGRA